jgi:hypothetical protein
MNAMLYIGHFSFDETNITGLARHGYFTMVTTAAAADEAVAAFESAIARRKGRDPLFDAMVAVYVEDIIELPERPPAPVMTRLQSSTGEFPESISHSLPGNKLPGAQAYALAADLAVINRQPDHTYKEMTPFIRFD